MKIAQLEQENQELKESNKEMVLVLEEVSGVLETESVNIIQWREGVIKLEQENQELKAQNEELTLTLQKILTGLEDKNNTTLPKTTDTPMPDELWIGLEAHYIDVRYDRITLKIGFSDRNFESHILDGGLVLDVHEDKKYEVCLF